MVGHKDSDIIMERRDLFCKRVSKKGTTQNRTFPSFQSRRTLDRESLRALSVHLHYRLKDVVHHANQFAKLQVESVSLQNSRQKPMVNLVEGFGLI